MRAPVDDPSRNSGRSRPFVRGWIVLTGVFLIMTITSGFAFYAQGLFLDALVDEQGFSTGLAGGGTGIFMVASAVCGYYTGKLINRFDVRWIMTVGTVISAAGMALLGQVREPWQLFAVMALFGVGFGLVGLVPTTSVVTRWFHRRRSVALSIASTGLSVGGVVIIPQLSSRIDADSLVQWAFPFAIMYLGTIIVSIWVFVRAWPHDVGLQPDGAAAQGGPGQPSGSAEIPAVGTPFEQAIRSRFFVLTSIGYVLVMGSQVGAIQHVYKLTKDRVGLAAAATVAVQALATTSIVARICGGLAAVRVPLRTLTTTLMVVQAGGLCYLAFADSRAGILAGVVVLGLAMGNLLMLHPLILADAFGVRDYPRIYGLGSLLMVIGAGGGPFVVGVLRDSFSYRTAFLVIAAAGVAGLVVYSFGGQPARDYLVTPQPQRPSVTAER